MGERERIVVEVGAEVAEALREAVASGEFDSVEHAARDAIEGWWTQRVAPVWPPDEVLRRLVDEALASGEPARDADEVFAELDAWLDAEHPVEAGTKAGAKAGAKVGAESGRPARRA